VDMAAFLDHIVVLAEFLFQFFIDFVAVGSGISDIYRVMAVVKRAR